MKQKYIDVINVCLKTMGAFGNEKSKADIAETIETFNAEISKPKHKCPYSDKGCTGEDITCYKCLNGGKDGEI